MVSGSARWITENDRLSTAAEATAGPSATVGNEVCSHNQREGLIKHFLTITSEYIVDVDPYKKTSIKNADASPQFGNIYLTTVGEFI